MIVCFRTAKQAEFDETLNLAEMAFALEPDLLELSRGIVVNIFPALKDGDFWRL